MPSIISSIIRRATRKPGDKLHILCFPTHERYQSTLAKTGHEFYLYQADGIKHWEGRYAKLPNNHHLLNKNEGPRQIPLDVDFDLTLSQTKFGQFQVAKEVSVKLNIPLISSELTWPMKWPMEQMKILKGMRGDLNIFLTNASRKSWGWEENEAEVIEHGIDSQDLFVPGDEKLPQILTVVNDYINRNNLCGFDLYRQVTQGLPTSPIGETPGFSTAAPDVPTLVKHYQKSSIFLNTSIESPIPTSLLEAAACGCAIVTTGYCEVPEVFKHNENAFITNNPDEMRGYLQTLLKDKEKAERMGKEARKVIVGRYGVDKFVNKWNDVFERACNITVGAI